MAVTGLTHCDFVIWTMCGMLVVPVEFDTEFWSTAKCQLQMFFENFVVAEILTERVWRALPLFDNQDSTSATSISDSCVDDAPNVMQDFDDDVVLEDDKMEDSFFLEIQLQSTNS